MNKRDLNSTTDIDLFEESIKQGYLTIKPKKIGVFTCGSFMRSILPNSIWESQKNGMDIIIYINNNRWGYDRNIVDWWMNIIKELDIDAEYFGQEGVNHIIRYKVMESFNQNMRLQRFTILRYLWAAPYRLIIEHMYTLKDSPEVKKHGFWHVFMKYHLQLSCFSNYSTTFGLTYGRKDVTISNKSFINKFLEKGNSKFGINQNFEGEDSGLSKTNSTKFKTIKFK